MQKAKRPRRGRRATHGCEDFARDFLDGWDRSDVRWKAGAVLHDEGGALDLFISNHGTYTCSFPADDVSEGDKKMHLARISFLPFTEPNRILYEEVVGKLETSSPVCCYAACLAAGLDLLPEEGFPYNEQHGVKRYINKGRDAAPGIPLPDWYESEWGVMSGACDCHDMASPVVSYVRVEAFKQRRPCSVPCKHITALIYRLAFLLGKDQNAKYRMRGLTPRSLLTPRVLRTEHFTTTIDLTSGEITGPDVIPRLHPLALRQVRSEEDNTLSAASAGPSEEPPASDKVKGGRAGLHA